MKIMPILRILLIVMALGVTACSNPLRNANDWPYNKGATVDYIPKDIPSH